MTDFEQKLLDILEQDTRFDPARSEVMRLLVVSEAKRKKRHLMIMYWVYQIIAVVFALPALGKAMNSEDVLGAVQGLTVFLIFLSFTICIKLWYWIVHSRLEIMRELKRLELRWTIAHNDENRPPESAQTAQ